MAPDRATARQLPLAACLATLLSGVAAVAGNVLLYLGDASAARIMREELGDGAGPWERNVLGRGVVSIALSLAVVAVGAYLVRRQWSHAPRHDFAIVLAGLGGFVVGPLLWAATFAVSELAYPR